MDHLETKLIQHKSHTKHPLKQVYKNSKFECKACKCDGRGFRYRCGICDFNIHPICGTGEESISSFAHPQHNLQLKKHSYISFDKCDLCHKTVHGMAYMCKDCDVFLHPVCTQIPEVLDAHVMHPPHPIRLRSMESQTYCDVCDKSCKHWRYNCEMCDVHIHVSCLTSKQRNGSDGDDSGFGEFIGNFVVQLAVQAVIGGSSS